MSFYLHGMKQLGVLVLCIDPLCSQYTGASYSQTALNLSMCTDKVKFEPLQTKLT